MISTHRRKFFLPCIALLHALAACGDQGLTNYQLSGPTMGTRFSVAVVTESEFDQQQLQARIHETLDDVDRRMSTYRTDSEVSKFNHSSSTDWIPVSRALCEAVDEAIELSNLTGGAFDITVGPLVDLWGFGPGDSLNEPPSDDAIAEAISRTGRVHLHANCEIPAIRKDLAGLHIDLSAYAKGLAADEIASLLDNQGIANYLVEIGGDLRARGHNASKTKWRIAIESPYQPGNAVEKIIHIHDLSVATSGDYRNFFEFEGQRYSHTIDPRTGRPVAHDLASVTVLADDAAQADALATALMVLGPEAGMVFAERQSIAAYLLLRDGSSITERMSTQFMALTDP
ncbi:MAG: FAD:protein FMN transferase [Proteobacteria bacterium]|nr:FAD:protein FMN transferase [Pseudomonadota bacterium]